MLIRAASHNADPDPKRCFLYNKITKYRKIPVLLVICALKSFAGLQNIDSDYRYPLKIEVLPHTLHTQSPRGPGFRYICSSIAASRSETAAVSRQHTGNYLSQQTAEINDACARFQMRVFYTLESACWRWTCLRRLSRVLNSFGQCGQKTPPLATCRASTWRQRSVLPADVLPQSAHVHPPSRFL